MILLVALLACAGGEPASNPAEATEADPVEAAPRASVSGLSAPPEAFETRAALLEAEASPTRVDIPLDGTGAASLPSKARRCHAVVVRLDPGVSWTPAARRGVDLVVIEPSGRIRTVEAEVYEAGAVAALGCTELAGARTVLALTPGGGPVATGHGQVAIRESKAGPDAFDALDLALRISRETGGATPLGVTAEGPSDQRLTLDIPVQKDHCYHLRLDFPEGAPKGSYVVDASVPGAYDLTSGVTVVGTTAVVELDCAGRDGTAQATWKPRGVAAGGTIRMSALARERPPRPARASGGGGGGGGGGGESDFAREQRAEVCSRCAKDLRSCTDDQGTCEFRYTGCVRAGMPYVGDPSTYCY